MGKLLDIDLIRSNANTKITFALPTGILEAYMIEDSFAVNGQATYNAIMEENISDMIAGQFDKGGDILKWGQKLMQVQAKNVLETTLSWEGCERPDFSLELLFVSVRAGEDVRKKVVQFLEGVFPEPGAGGLVMKPPWGYDLLGAGGKFAISIGKWFRAPNQVLTSVNFRLSTEVNEEGTNLYAQGNIAFKPNKMLFKSDIKGYFPGV
jgi:hypothetical protein